MSLQYISKNIILGIAISFFCSCASKDKTSNNSYKLTQSIDSLLTVSYERGLFNGNALVVKNDTIVYQKSFGFTDVSQQTKLNEASIFNIGSIAKEINGVSIMILKERGKLSLDDYVSKFDLGLPKWSEKITIRHLLNYAGGLPMKDADMKSDEIAFETLKKIDSLLFEPGSSFSYNNYSIFIQQRIIEKVTNKTYKAFVIENIVKPLKMTSAVFDATADYPKRTSCYNFDRVECPEMEYISGWLMMDINDLYRWVKAMNSNTLISQESFDTLLRNPYVKNRASALGEYFEEQQLQRHNGSSYSFQTVYLNDFKDNLTIILFSNANDNVIELGHVVHDIMLGKDFEVPKKSIRRALQKDFIASVDQGIKAYYKLKQSNTSDLYNFKSPIQLNRLCVDAYRQGITIEESIKVFKFAVSEFPNDTILLGNLGEMYFENKAYDLALENFKKVLTIDADNSKAKKKIKEINTLTQKTN